MELGERLKLLRKEKSLQQADLGEILNVHKGSISNWETNKRMPDYDILCKIGKYFNVSIDYLLGQTNERQLQAKNRILGIDEEELRCVLENLKYFNILHIFKSENKFDEKTKLQIIKNFLNKD